MWPNLAHPEDDPFQLTISPELEEPLSVLSGNLKFLIRPLSTVVFRRVFRLALSKLHDQLWSEVLMRRRFTAFGATQFLHDCQAVFSVIDRFLPGSSSVMAKLKDGVALLNLPLALEVAAPTTEGVDRDAAVLMTLMEANDRVYKDNSEARKVLGELGLTCLTPTEAREITMRRVELQG